MSAPLVLVSAVEEDGRPVATWVEHEGDALLVMAPDRARRLSEVTRDALAVAGTNLIELRAGNAHLALGFDAWHEYVQFWFGDLTVYRLVKDREARVAEREALVASLTLAGHTVREQRDLLGASLGTVHGDQRRLGLVPDRPLPAVVDQPAPADPFRGLSPIDEALARVAAQADRGLTSLELQAEWDRPIGTATGSLSRLERRGLVRLGGLEEARGNRRPYRVCEAGRVKLAQVLAARDTTETGPDGIG
jgi:hypothetical protein